MGDADRDEVTVYNYLTFEAPYPAPYKAPRDHIEGVLRGRVLEGTGEQISRAQLDDKGRYRRIASGWGELLD